MGASILFSIRKLLGGLSDDPAFETDLLIHINALLAVLTQLGVGPAEGMSIADGSTAWRDLLGDDPKWRIVQTWMYLRTKLVFDPPTIGTVADSMKKQADEYEWRISILADEEKSKEG